MNDVRKPAVAGTFYPADPEDLRREVGGMLSGDGTEEALGADHPYTINQHVLLGEFLIFSDKVDAGDSLFRQALEIGTRVLGDDHAPISSTKSMLGHAMGASGAIEALVCALSLYHQKILAADRCPIWRIRASFRYSDDIQP